MAREAGDTVDRRVVEDIHQRDPDIQGVLALSGVQNGLFHEEEWRVLARKGDWLVASYCGTMTSWTYRWAARTRVGARF